MKPIFNIEQFIQLNANSYNTYYLLGRYYLKQSKRTEARKLFTIALTKNLPSQTLKNEIDNYLIDLE
jgi:Tfp pilus assembly protein PilF